MNIFLGHTTACLFWLTATQPQLDRLRPSSCTPEPLSTSQLRSIPLALEGIFPNTGTIHVETPRTHHTARIDGLNIHSCSTGAPQEYLRHSSNIFISSPELTFMQMASTLNLHELVLLGTELCGAFMRSSFSPTGLEDREQLTTVKNLKKAVSHGGKFAGKDKATKALRFIKEGVKSPKEAETAARFGISHLYGGDGLPLFECNYRLNIPPALKHLTDKPYIEVDFCWPKQKVAVEYDSDLHTGSEKITKDTTRRNILVSQGFKVIGITRLQSKSHLEMDRVAEQVAIALGTRRDVRTQKHYVQKGELLRTLDQWMRPSPEQFFENPRFQ